MYKRQRKASEAAVMALLLDARSFCEKVDLLQVQERATWDKVHHPAKTPLAYMEQGASRRPVHISSSRERQGVSLRLLLNANACLL